MTLVSSSLLLDLPASGPTRLCRGDRLAWDVGRVVEVRRVLWQGTHADGACVEVTEVPVELTADAKERTVANLG